MVAEFIISRVEFLSLTEGFKEALNNAAKLLIPKRLSSKPWAITNVDIFIHEGVSLGQRRAC